MYEQQDINQARTAFNRDISTLLDYLYVCASVVVCLGAFLIAAIVTGLGVNSLGPAIWSFIIALTLCIGGWYPRKLLKRIIPNLLFLWNVSHAPLPKSEFSSPAPTVHDDFSYSEGLTAECRLVQ